MPTGWREVMVHVPAIGAESPQATYRITTSSGATVIERVLNQRWNENKWISLGTFNFGTGGSVALSNQTYTDHDPANVGRQVRIAWDAIAFVPSTAPTVRYVALGDSYSADEGVEPYDSSADVGGQRGDGGEGGRFRNACHRSQQAYPALIAQAANVDDFHFLACSGAIISDLNGDPSSHADAQWTELPQLSQGYLDANTTHITVGIGGNDVRFADVIGGCSLPLTDCSESTFVLPGDTQPLISVQTDLISITLRDDLAALFDDIEAQAPNATVVVIGYPLLFNRTPGDLCFGLNNISPNEATFLDGLASLAASVIQSAAINAGFLYYDPNPAWNGHRICDGDANSSVNQIILSSSSGSSEWVPSLNAYRDLPGSGTYHPRAAGHTAVASGIRARLGI
jgi:GDSL-like Lipase/Acylhydrolase family